jgi:hypothetical protein
MCKHIYVDSSIFAQFFMGIRRITLLNYSLTSSEHMACSSAWKTACLQLEGTVSSGNQSRELRSQ